MANRLIRKQYNDARNKLGMSRAQAKQIRLENGFNKAQMTDLLGNMYKNRFGDYEITPGLDSSKLLKVNYDYSDPAESELNDPIKLGDYEVPSGIDPTKLLKVNYNYDEPDLGEIEATTPSITTEIPVVNTANSTPQFTFDNNNMNEYMKVALSGGNGHQNRLAALQSKYQGFTPEMYKQVRTAINNKYSIPVTSTSGSASSTKTATPTSSNVTVTPSGSTTPPTGSTTASTKASTTPPGSGRSVNKEIQVKTNKNNGNQPNLAESRNESSVVDKIMNWFEKK